MKDLQDEQKRKKEHIAAAKTKLTELLNSGKISGVEYNNRIIALEVPKEDKPKYQVSERTKKLALAWLILPIIIAVILVAVFLGWRFYFQNTLTASNVPNYSDTYLSSPDKEPIQISVNDTKESGEYKGRQANIVYKYYYDMSGVVTSVHDYWGFDDYATLVPRDVCIVWGELKDLYLDGGAEFSQVDRHCSGKITGGGLDLAETFTFKTALGQTRTSVSSMSNNHLIPSTTEIRSKIFGLKAGDKVRITGYLVNIHYGKISLNSSTTREDSGNGACEVIYVTGIENI